ncbi:FecR family protein [Spirosoma spitsbergense]|uniref:FecR family protein n=1 Tax=Spirosoma spitsbergense TaxID=431554 RepID=UPI00037F80FE|nr:FecR domain-containing protein [Spirosoma spitsbergense]
MKADITKELIFNNFANKTTPLQRKQIDDWLQSQTNEELYYQWLEEWENANLEYLPQSERLLERYTHFLHNNPHPVQANQLKNRSGYFQQRQWWLTWLIAASVLFVLAMGTWLFRDYTYYKTYQTAYGEVKTFVLTDGSQVTLNANSSLRIPRWGFGDQKREVILDGEAGFTVTHLPNHQKFLVKTDKKFEVVVLGTEFSVFARHRGARVILEKGKVQVNYQEGNSAKQLVMKPGDLVSFNAKNQATLKTVSPSQNFSIWKEKRFVFDEISLSDVAQLLEETYGLSVTIDTPELAQRKLMGSFRAENVDELLRTISDLLDINVVRQEDQVRLSEK